MEESRTFKSLQNMVTGLGYKFVGILMPFLIRTIMIKKLGADYLGLSSLLTSILQVLSLSELGIGGAMVYSMYKPLAEHDDDLICALLSLYRKLYAMVGLVILLLGLALSPFLEYFIKGGYPSDVNIYVLYFIFLFNTVISYFLFAYKKSILDAMQKVSIENTIQMIMTTIMYLCQIWILYYMGNYYLYIVLLPITTIFINLIRNRMINKLYPQYQSRGRVEKDVIKELTQKIKALIGHKIGSNVIWFTDSIVISAFLGLSSLAVYSNYYYIMNAVIGIIAIFYNSILASIGNSLVTETNEKNHNDFIELSCINFWLTGWCTVCLICLYQPFMELWMGQDLMYPFSIVVVFGCYFYFWLFNKVGNTYKNAAGMWQEDFWKPYVSSAINLILNIILVNVIGIAGVLLSTIIAAVFVETPWETYVLYKYLFKRSPIIYLKKIVLYTVVTIIACTVTYKVCLMISTGLILTLFVRGAICLIIPNIIFCIVFFKTNEFRSLKNRIGKILNK